MTDQDLRQVILDAVPPLTSPPDRMRDVGRRVRRQRLRRTGMSVAATVAVVAVAAASVTLLPGKKSQGGQHDGTPAIQPAAPAVVAPLDFTFGTYAAGAYRVEAPQEVTPTYQAAEIVADYRDSAGKPASAFVGTLTVYAPGVHPPAIFTTGTKVTVHGLPGFANERNQDALLVSDGFAADRNPVTAMANTLAWQYEAGRWAVINSVIQYAGDLSHRMTAADERALADAFSLGTPSRARIPLRAGYLPAGWQVVYVRGRSFTAEDVAMIEVMFAPSASVATNRIRHFIDASDGPAVMVAIIRDQAPPPDAPKTHKTCLRDNDGLLTCSWKIPHSRYAFVLHDPANVMSSAQLTRIGEGLTFDNLDRPDTWHLVS